MIIPNMLMRLNYEPATDVLQVEWPDFLDQALSETSYSLDSIIETAINYDVKYLLIDATKSIMKVSDSQYIELVFKFANDLENTRLKKLARVITAASMLDRPVRNMLQKSFISVLIENFDNVEDALKWLSTDKPH